MTAPTAQVPGSASGDAGTEWDVVIVGAGPVGLMAANLLGLHGVRTLVVETREELIDYPRGVGMDDETLRVFQSAGLVDEVLPHTVPNQPLSFLDGRGRVLAEMAPSTSEFGWPRRNGFVQPLVDRVLLEGLDRFEHVQLAWSTTMEGLVDDGDSVVLSCRTAGEVRRLRASYVVGADGGRSAVRRASGIDFPGTSSPTDWLVVDLRNDPLGRPGAFVHADPRRPHVSISIPHGIRRFEFMLLPGERAADAEDERFIHGLLEGLVPEPRNVEIIRRRVYTHHSRIADRFSSGRVFLAGDAAHLMPVWQGQGYNSGIRDAANLAWKLAMVVGDKSEQQLLESYHEERRAHAASMIEISTFVGRVVTPTSKPVATARDLLLRTSGLVPWVKRYLVEMRFKPMPTFTRGAVTLTGTQGHAGVVGRLFPQPWVTIRDGGDVRLDDAIGQRFAVLSWNNDPRSVLSEDALGVVEALGAQLVSVRPASQLRWAAEDHPSVLTVGDRDGRLQAWFQRREESVIVVRPDRVVAGASRAQDASAMVAAVGRVTALPTDRRLRTVHRAG